MTEINWSTTDEEFDLIAKIADRASARIVDLDRTNTVMDITACHLNGNPLDLARLLEFPSLVFTHDIMGILVNMDRDTGKLRNHFSPRSTKRD